MGDEDTVRMVDTRLEAIQHAAYPRAPSMGVVGDVPVQSREGHAGHLIHLFMLPSQRQKQH